MNDRNPFAPPSGAVTEAERPTHALVNVCAWGWALVVFALTAFNAYDAPFLVAVTRQGAMPPIELLALLSASVCLPLAALVTLARRRAARLLWCSLVLGALAVFPVIWYQMILAVFLSALGLVLDRIQSRAAALRKNSANATAG